MAQAMAWHLKASDQGFAPAEMAVGTFMRTAGEFPKDDQQALFWYRKAADQGYAIAQESVGIAYVNGLGVSVDFSQARAWFDKAIAGGDTEAENYLCPTFQQARLRGVASKNVTEMDRVLARIDP